MTIINTNNYCFLKEAAGIIETTPGYVHQLAWAGQVQTINPWGGDRLYSKKDLLKIREERIKNNKIGEK